MLKENGIETASKTYPRWQYEVAEMAFSFLLPWDYGIPRIQCALCVQGGALRVVSHSSRLLVVAGLFVFVSMRLLRRDGETP